jgi:glycine/D-amino acid oxidase-like deaminating enzyme
MTQRQILCQLAEAGGFGSKTSTTLPWSTCCATNLSPWLVKTVTLTDKGRRRVAPKKTTIKVAKPLHPLTSLRRNYPVGRREQPSKRGYYAAEERSRREVAEWMERHGPPPIDWSNPDPERQKELRELARLLSAPL